MPFPCVLLSVWLAAAACGGGSAGGGQPAEAGSDRPDALGAGGGGPGGAGGRDGAQPGPDTAPGTDARPGDAPASDGVTDAPPGDTPLTGDGPGQPPPDVPPGVDRPPPSPAVVLSEIMYHPVLENDYEDQHEFVELHNRADFPFDISGWKLGGEVSYAFPAGTSIPALGFLVVAKNRAALATVASYGLNASSLHGDYTGQLDNGGGLLVLLDAAGVAVDAVRYDDRFPWPVAGDALGAGDNWLPPSLLPLTAHQYRGVSLERASYDLPAAEVANWLPSPLDGPTPGRPNSVQGAPPPIVETLSAAPAGGQPLIRSSDEVVVRATLSAWNLPSDVRLEYFIDDLERSDEARTVVAMTAAGQNFEARLPARPDNSIVRYRILADRGAGLAVLSPRPSDPYPFHAYFVSPVVTSVEPPYQLFINSAQWGQLWTNINFSDSNDRRVIPETASGSTFRCRVRDTWDERVPAVFVSEGQVYDVRVRYQGSRWNRPNGSEIDLSRTRISPLPNPMMQRSNGTGALKALSWNISFPRYGTFEGQRDPLILNKLNQSCPGLDAAVGAQMYEAAGLAASPVRYRRLYVNGGYYDYALDIEVPGEELMARYTATGERVGDLFKSSGTSGTEEGPWGRGDGSPLPASCTSRSPSWQPAQRYASTYERKTWEWKDAGDIQSLLMGLDAARAAGSLNDSNAGNDNLAPVRAFFDQNFDVARMTDYVAIRNWSVPWDDFFHNYYAYRDARGKWSLVPWDLDREFGENFGWNAFKSFYIGERGDPDGRSGEWNRIKDAFIRAYRSELLARLVYLDSAPSASDAKKGALSPERFRGYVQTAATKFSQADWSASPVQSLCNFDQERTSMLRFGEERHSALQDVVACASASCGLKGEYYKARSFNAPDLAVTRTDRLINFDWGAAAPASGVPVDNFQVRWTGKLTAPASGSYTLYTRSDDGVRLWVNGQLLIDNWMNPSTSERSGTINLTGGQAVDIRLEYFEASSGALVQLAWSTASMTKQMVPGRVLTPAP